MAVCGCGGASGSRVGSKNFTEQILLGEIVALHLENQLDTPVTRRLDLGGTLLAHQALTSGGIDVYPEYTGTALTAVLKLPPQSGKQAVFERVQQEYRNRYQMLWLSPLGFDNSFAMVIPGDLARREGIRTLSQAAGYQKAWALGVGYEFIERPDGLPALKRTYNLPLADDPRTMDLGLLYRALEQGQVNMVAANTTDGLLSVLDVVVLEDDKHAFPPYQAALVIREITVSEQPKMVEALRQLSGTLPEQTMRSLNHAVDGNHEPVRGVAERFLESTGLTKV